MGIGNQLKQILDERNMNVNEFAKLLEVRAQRIYNIINRDTKKVRAEFVQQIAKTLGVPLDYFYSNDSLSEFIQNSIENMSDNNHSKKEKKDIIMDQSNTKNLVVGYAVRFGQQPGDDFYVDIDYHTTNSLNNSDRTLQLISYYYYLLNDLGKKELIKRLTEMIRLNEYTAKNNGDDQS